MKACTLSDTTVSPSAFHNQVWVNYHSESKASHLSPTPPCLRAVKWSNTKPFVWADNDQTGGGDFLQDWSLLYFYPDPIKTHTLYDPWHDVTGKSSLLLENTTSLLSSECLVLQTAATDASVDLQELIFILWIFVCSESDWIKLGYAIYWFHIGW